MSAKNSQQSPIVLGQSISATVILPVTTIRYLDNISYQINIKTTNSVGTFAVQGSNDFNGDLVNTGVVNPGNWVNLPLSGTPSASGANDTIIIDMSAVPFIATRLVYTSSVAGTGTIDVWLGAHRLGG
jgi:hypothetical protein